MSNSLKASGLEFAGVLDGKRYVFIADFIHFRIFLIRVVFVLKCTINKMHYGLFQLKNLDPFLMLDEFCIAKPAGFPDHPHRGFETVNAIRSYTLKL